MATKTKATRTVSVPYEKVMDLTMAEVLHILNLVVDSGGVEWLEHAVDIVPGFIHRDASQ